ncbi:DUF3040 domain-containing protein [Streptomyces sp. CC208A]|uniref:DUF3040 domain-containing protein n=1 Tax=Streptomyces sp. CC208A TaxID=3044573 RepID=UPI0024A95B88|nr:DUF3040 domain-containing protein [Streptomyces sp. CC208A]
MGHLSDDWSDLAAIEHALAKDDPVLAARMDTLNQQFPEESATHPGEPAPRRDRRVVAAVVLGALALPALLLTAVLGSSSSSGDEESGVRPAALPVATASHGAP